MLDGGYEHSPVAIARKRRNRAVAVLMLWIAACIAVMFWLGLAPFFIFPLAFPALSYVFYVGACTTCPHCHANLFERPNDLRIYGHWIEDRCPRCKRDLTKSLN